MIERISNVDWEKVIKSLEKAITIAATQLDDLKKGNVLVLEFDYRGNDRFVKMYLEMLYILVNSLDKDLAVMAAFDEKTIIAAISKKEKLKSVKEELEKEGIKVEELG